MAKKADKTPSEAEPIIGRDEERGLFVATYEGTNGSGFIELPGDLDGGLYRKLANEVKRRDGDLDDAYRLESRWRAVTALGTVDMVVNGKIVDNESLFDDVPFRVLKWARDVLDEWLAPFLVGDDWRETLTTLLAARGM